jgi:hypothetical protein
LGLACVGLQWSPRTFWESTPHEFFAALEAKIGKTDEDQQGDFDDMKIGLDKLQEGI